MNRKYVASAYIAVILSAHCLGLAQEPPSFEAMDITGWSEAELSRIPFFKKYIPTETPGAPSTFEAAARNNSGVTVGTFGTNVDLAIYMHQGVAENLNYLGQYYWENLYWDGEDWHFQNGRVYFGRLLDVNASGVAVGESTVEGSGDSSGDWGSAAVIYDPSINTGLVGFSDGYERGTASGINDGGEITGWVSGISSITTAFRRDANGNLTMLQGLGGSSRGTSINNAGLIAGQSVDTATSRYHAAVCLPGATVMQDIGIPDQGPSDASAAYDVNNNGWVCGAAWDQAAPYEHYAALWVPGENNTWTPYDLKELMVTEDILPENALAINDQDWMIVRGRPDGSDAYGSRLYLLMPEGEVLPPLVVTPEAWEIF